MLNTSEDDPGPKQTPALKHIIISVMWVTEAEVRAAHFSVQSREDRTECTFLWRLSHRSWSRVDQVQQKVVVMVQQCEAISFASYNIFHITQSKSCRQHPCPLGYCGDNWGDTLTTGPLPNIGKRFGLEIWGFLLDFRNFIKQLFVNNQTARYRKYPRTCQHIKLAPTHLHNIPNIFPPEPMSSFQVVFRRQDLISAENGLSFRDLPCQVESHTSLTQVWSERPCFTCVHLHMHLFILCA